MTLLEISRNLDILTAGWFPDPRGEHRLRFFDGSAWTSHVTHFGPTPCRGCGGTS